MGAIDDLKQVFHLQVYLDSKLIASNPDVYTEDRLNSLSMNDKVFALEVQSDIAPELLPGEVEYAPLEHEHNEDYAAIVHDHLAYALVEHDHDGEYAPPVHTHSEYVTIDHFHDSDYAPIVHNHDGEYADPIHSHSEYSTTDHTHEFVETVYTTDDPIGTIRRYISDSVPLSSDWLPCNGAAISRATYPELYAVVEDSFGNGDGSTTFNLPDVSWQQDVPIFGIVPFSMTSLGSGVTSPPAASSSGSAWSPDGTYLAIGLASSPFLIIYKRTAPTTLTKLTDPATMPTGAGNGVAWSPNGNYFVIAHSNSPYITVYQRSGDTFTKLANPAVLPSAASASMFVSWNFASAMFSVGHYLGSGVGSVPIEHYSVSGSTLTKYTEFNTGASTDLFGIAWHPTGNYFAIASSTSPYVTLYSRSGTTFTVIDTVTDLPGGAQTIKWSPDGNYLVVSVSVSPRLAIYSFISDNLTKVAEPDIVPTGIQRDIAWSNTGGYLAVAHSSNKLTVYKFNTGTNAFTRHYLAPAPVGDFIAKFLDSDAYVNVVGGTSPYSTFYSVTKDGTATNTTTETFYDYIKAKDTV